ncbi:MauE/DoxX family redox-associated membrane protein [Mucilaginibacter sp. RCC_168]|uniref:MauE/DoxX family redox-associated membrane protein n=1 Tax=Mucilaginibacter sp. RCC_168 TaxID=3239221 RepID=UPI003526245C
MKSKFKQSAIFLFILLFVYAAASKLMTFQLFRGQLYNQDFPHLMADFLLYALPTLELITVGLLCIPRTQRLGLLVSLLLMSAFTGYITLVMLHFWNRVPCSCGGILSHMGWGAHLVFNCVFLLMALVSILIPDHPREKLTSTR